MADAAASVTAAADASAEQRRRVELARRALVADLATSTRVSEWTVTRLLSESADLCVRFATAVDALQRGEISRQHLTVIHDIGDPSTTTMRAPSSCASPWTARRRSHPDDSRRC